MILKRELCRNFQSASYTTNDQNIVSIHVCFYVFIMICNILSGICKLIPKKPECFNNLGIINNNNLGFSIPVLTTKSQFQYNRRWR